VAERVEFLIEAVIRPAAQQQMQRRLRRRDRLNNSVCRERGITLLFSVALHSTGSGLAGCSLVIRQSVCRFYQGATEKVRAEGARFDKRDANAERR